MKLKNSDFQIIYWQKENNNFDDKIFYEMMFVYPSTADFERSILPEISTIYRFLVEKESAVVSGFEEVEKCRKGGGDVNFVGSEEEYVFFHQCSI